MSRLRFSFSLAALIVLATAFVACGGGGGGANSSESPQKVVDNATLKGVESGNLDLSLSVKAKGEEGGNLDVSLSGPFQSEGGGKLPQLDMKAAAKGSIGGKDVNFDGGLVLLPNSAYVGYKGTEYEVDPTTFSFVQQAIRQAQQKAGGKEGAGTTACQEAAENLKFSDFMENLSNEGGADVGGTETTKVSGDLDVSGAIDSFLKLAEEPACAAQLGASPLPPPSELGKAKGEIQKALKKAHVEIYVGEDHIVRRIVVQLTIEPPKSGEGPESVQLEFDVSLSGVNEDQSIEAPSGAKPLNDLFLKLGINPIELLGPNGSPNLGGLLKGLGGASGASGGGSAETEAESEGSAGGGASGQQAYLKCIQGAKTPVDLQKCAGLLK